MAGRPPKPTIVHLVQGTKRPDRHGRRKGELDPADTALPEPPEWLGAHGRKEWLRLLQDSKYRMALRSADWTALATYCSMWDEFVRVQQLRAKSKGEPVKPSYIAAMISLGGRLGLNPADRCKIKVPEPEKPKTGWNQFRIGS